MRRLVLCTLRFRGFGLFLCQTKLTGERGLLIVMLLAILTHLPAQAFSFVALAIALQTQLLLAPGKVSLKLLGQPLDLGLLTAQLILTLGQLLGQPLDLGLLPAQLFLTLGQLPGQPLDLRLLPAQLVFMLGQILGQFASLGQFLLEGLHLRA